MFDYKAMTYSGAVLINVDYHNDLELLYSKIVSRYVGYFGDYHGLIIDNKSLLVMRSFRVCALE